MMHEPPSLPENWDQLTREEKRHYRMDRFLNPPGVEFISPEAREAYRIRARRIVDVYNIQEPDRVPLNLPVGNLPLTLYGINMHTAMYEAEKAVEACNQFNRKYSAELEYFASPMTISVRTMDILDFKLLAWPGHGLSTDAPGYQFLEGEYMKADEYSALVRDPSDFWMRTFLPRVFSAFEPLRILPPLTDLLEIAPSQLAVLKDPRIRNTLRKLLEVGEEAEKRDNILAPYIGMGAASGFPNSMAAINKAPFDILGDSLRGTQGIMKDLYRRPDRILEALEVICEVTTTSILSQARASQGLVVMLPLHKGADGWMSQKQFDTFYFPSLKKMMDALIADGLIVTLFAEGSFNTRLESINVFPRGTVCWYFDQTDMVKAKEVLGDRCCIQGNVPASLITTGSPGDVKECCRKLIKDCGKGGGYIMAAGCVAENPRLENLRAMLEAVREYGVYR
ncbi:MAG: hypothetical protein JXA46_15665 [Dehalococcoidales bacterium]|nr:hypothetical protein [Dehalococcoidales bacterium]